MIKILLLVLAVSVDCFAAAIGIGSAGIKIPLRSVLVISAVGAAFLGVSVGFAEIIMLAVPSEICRIISSALLILLGVFNLCQNFFRKLAERKRSGRSSPAAMFFDGAAADTDGSKSISPMEALVLSAALSADSLVTGVSAGLGRMNLPVLCAGAFFAGILAISSGWRLGKKIVSSVKINLGWVCGAILIVLAFVK